ncbi:MAG: DUF6596 domain-containing protein [Bacteroidota bacterium]
MELIPQLFRTEFRKMTAVLCKHFGLSNMQVAEDIVSETFLLAAETWGKKGLPDNQVAWLYTVAKNKTRDHLRRDQLFRDKISPDLQHTQAPHESPELDFSTPNISDSQLQMMFAICHPAIPMEAQIGLTLRILCGFGIEEIADAFLSKKDTINKRLFRAKEKLRKARIEIAFPPTSELQGRMEAVLRSLYLLFNEGYYSASPNKTLRKDFCLEAMRLALMLSQNERTNQPNVNALLALMCFHASRFDARLDDNGAFVLYGEQDHRQWNQELIEKGELYLNKAATGKQLSRYHLEAAIAYWHTRSEDTDEKWENILQLYNYLLQVEYSPMAALNRTYALAKANGYATAIREAKKINLEQHHLYHCLLAELYRPSDRVAAKVHLAKALHLAKAERDKVLINKKLASL